MFLLLAPPFEKQVASRLGTLVRNESVSEIWVLGLVLESEVDGGLLNPKKFVYKNTDENPSQEEDPPRLGSFELQGVPYES